ncbi:MAG: adenine phosphoribosyltransferase, partial [Alphaproteobacteria bacterium]
AIDETTKRWSGLGVTKIVGIDARGFILGGAIAYNLGVGFLPVRKKGKLPPKTISEEYQLEYGVDTLEVLENSLDSSDKVVVVDDLIATGGTAEATVKLIRRLKAEVLGCSFVINLPDLGGVSKLNELGVESFSLCEFKGH